MADHPRQPSRPDRRRQAGASPEAADGGGRDGKPDGERVAKRLARAGVASRREVERLIAEGRVALNGQVLDTPAVKITGSDVLTVDGRAVAEREPTRLWRYHKPAGLVTSHNDPQGRPTVFEALPDGLPRVISIGRLDLNSEGLLLLTNDGELARALELPSSGWVRRYRARAFGRVSQERLDALRQGITVEGVVYDAIEARLDKVQHRPGAGPEAPANAWISVALTEGKNREVRRVLESLGLKVNRLVRLAYGPFALATLPVGAVEEVGPRVIREQLVEFVAPADMPAGSRPPGPPAARPTVMSDQTSAARRGVARRGAASDAPVAKDESAKGEGANEGRAQPARQDARPYRPPPGLAAEAETRPKPVYKPGWARPKIAKSPHPHPPKRSRKSVAADAAEPASYRATIKPRGRVGKPAPCAAEARGAREAPGSDPVRPGRGRATPPKPSRPGGRRPPRG